MTKNQLNMRFSIGILASLIFVTSCVKKSATPPPDTVIRTGKVINSICGNTTIQFTDGSPYGQMGWQPEGDSIVYNHVFRVANPCNVGDLIVNSTVRFRFVPASPQNCVQCMAWGPTPNTAYNIQILP